MKRNEQARPIAEVLEDLVPKLGPKRGKMQRRLWEAWKGTVGEEIANYTRINTLRRGNLHIEVQSPTVLQELTGMNKTKIIATMRERLGKTFLTNIRLKLTRD